MTEGIESKAAEEAVFGQAVSRVAVEKKCENKGHGENKRKEEVKSKKKQQNLQEQEKGDEGFGIKEAEGGGEGACSEQIKQDKENDKESTRDCNNA